MLFLYLVKVDIVLNDWNQMPIFDQREFKGVAGGQN
jgi:hypothetical protein